MLTTCRIVYDVCACSRKHVVLIKAHQHSPKVDTPTHCLVDVNVLQAERACQVGEQEELERDRPPHQVARIVRFHS